jgi:hypothetical protein
MDEISAHPLICWQYRATVLSCAFPVLRKTPDIKRFSSQRLQLLLSLCLNKYCVVKTYEGVTKSFRTGRLERELQMVQLPATRCSCITILWVSLVSFAAITHYVAPERVFIVVKHIFRYRLIPETSGYTIVWYSGGVAPHILKLGTRRRWVIGFTARPLYPWDRAPTIHWIRGCVDTRASLDEVAKRGNSFTVQSWNRTPVVQPIF